MRDDHVFINAVCTLAFLIIGPRLCFFVVFFSLACTSSFFSLFNSSVVLKVAESIFLTQFLILSVEFLCHQIQLKICFFITSGRSNDLHANLAEKTVIFYLLL